MNTIDAAIKPILSIRSVRKAGKTTISWPRAISVAVVTVMVFGLWALRWNGPIDLRYDAAVYYVLGTSLASGEGYRIISEPGAPEDIQYPPLLPAIVRRINDCLERRIQPWSGPGSDGPTR